jgi:xanthine/CO dehydrogenase XdhC/CoxF family maturation factor
MREPGPASVATAVDSAEDPSCAVAHGVAPAPAATRTLVAVFASPVARYLLRYGQDLGFHPILVEPDAGRLADFPLSDVDALPAVPALDDSTDLVVTDHHRDELGYLLRDALQNPARWIGILGNPRHPGPHLRVLHELGVSEPEIARVHRPVGLNIGSRTPPEIAIATLAGLLADRNDRPGGFEF